MTSLDCTASSISADGGRKSPDCRCRSVETPSGARSAAETMTSVTQAMRESIQYAIDHRDEALAYAMQFARDLDAQLADKFVGMYVNERTLDYGDDGREAVKRLLDMGHKAGIIPQTPKVEWV
jgi:predicted solute-binding protein